MRWKGRRRSSNVEDRRGVRIGKGGGLSIGIIVLGLVAMYFGVDPRVVMQVGSQLGGGQVTEERVDYQPTAKEKAGRVRVGGAGRYRGRLEPGVQAHGEALRRAHAGALQRRGAVGRAIVKSGVQASRTYPVNDPLLVRHP